MSELGGFCLTATQVGMSQGHHLQCIRDEQWHLWLWRFWTEGKRLTINKCFSLRHVSIFLIFSVTLSKMDVYQQPKDLQKAMFVLFSYVMEKGFQKSIEQ